ncbi:AbrB/MazE/SpoVT family DNA-binding domain-containing protein [Candidatus Formimonas warabiya]|nr:AbrB/MazE/SpoVT family DNA-binding domain-containing protein [Candidatus Formimonas warabiya]
MNERKRITVSQKRQITIPKKFFQMLGISDEVECFIKNNSLIIKPVHREYSGEFAEEILQDLISQGLSGQELLEKFREINKKVRPAVEALIAEADRAASELIGNGDDQVKDIFSSEE